jgi:hypothetical protein
MARRDASGRTDAVGVVADELYGLPLDNFTAARNERAKRARADGDSGTAVAIGKLAKPSTVAWLANQLVREHADEIRPLLELGDSMRRATAALDAGQLRELSRQQRQVVQALVRRAHRLANAAGQAVSANTARGLESEGRLTSGLSRSGFPGIEPSAQEVAAPSPAARGRAKADRQAGTGEAAARRGRAEHARRDETDARSDAEEAVRNQEKARDALRHADRGAREAAGNVERLQSELDAAQEARADAVRAQRRAHTDADRADRGARQAERRLQDATGRRKNLEG